MYLNGTAVFTALLWKQSINILPGGDLFFQKLIILIPLQRFHQSTCKLQSAAKDLQLLNQFLTINQQFRLKNKSLPRVVRFSLFKTFPQTVGNSALFRHTRTNVSASSEIKPSAHFLFHLSLCRHIYWNGAFRVCPKQFLHEQTALQD